MGLNSTIWATSKFSDVSRLDDVRSYAPSGYSLGQDSIFVCAVTLECYPQATFCLLTAMTLYRSKGFVEYGFIFTFEDAVPWTINGVCEILWGMTPLCLPKWQISDKFSWKSSSTETVENFFLKISNAWQRPVQSLLYWIFAWGLTLVLLLLFIS